MFKDAKEKLSAIRKVLFGEETTVDKFIDAALEDGTPITIHGEKADVGILVSLKDGTPLADGDYTLADGTLLSILAGAITALEAAPPVEEEAAEEAEEEEAAGEDVSALKTAIADVLAKFAAQEKTNEKLSAQIKLQGETIVAQTEAFKQTLALVELLIKEPAAEKAEAKKSPFAAMRPDPEEKMNNLIETLKKLKEEKEKV